MDIRFELFKIGFLKVTVFDVLDILAISYILYKLYFFIRGSRAGQMSVGLVLILFLSVMASLFNLSGMTWIFENLRTIWLLAFVIIFQPELRRLLVNLGQSPIIRLFIKVGESKVVDEVIKASLELSKRGYGALIVMVRDTGIKAVTETGVNLQAEVSMPLIVSIFNPRSPLHDGALVIQNELVQAAKCILPLSQDPTLDPSLGTRHRAAVGLAEESDAVTVVVSEETSKISIAMDGQLHRDLDYESFKGMLNEAFNVKAAA